MRRGLWFVCAAAVFAGGCGTSVPQPGPADYVLSVPEMHCGQTCETRVRTAVKTLPFVEPDSVRPSLPSRQVLFRVKKGHAFDLPAARKALADAGYDKVEVVTEPKE